MREHGRDQRRAKRTPRRNAAWIGLAGGGTHIPCVLWDISEDGARLAAPRTSVLPSAFKLLLTKDGSSQRLCRVVWRNDKQLGVQFIQGSIEDFDTDLGPRRRRAQADTAPAATPRASRPVDTASLVLPGCGPHIPPVVEQKERRDIPVSTLAAGMLFMLAAATVLFFVAGMQSELDVPWARDVCASADNFCRHPEWTGAASVLMLVVYLAVRGMES